MQYIELGWHTVPLSGTIKRLPDGTKTVPFFEKDWRDKYTATFNEKAVPLMGAITGKCSGIVAIDCDNTAAFEIFKALDPDYEVIFYSIGKGNQLCGTFIYSYEDGELEDTFKLHNEILSLDFYNANGFIYLPCENNHTKQAAPHLNYRKMPEATKALLLQLKKQNTKQVVNTAVASSYSCLAPLVAQFNQTRKYMPGLFRILTPRDFRDIESYVRDGHLHPKEVPDGRGSEYLSKVSAILGADISINQEMYVQALTLINSLFTVPMVSKRLDSTIIDPMLDGAAIDGVEIWQYDENWDRHRVILPTKRQASLELMYDDVLMEYFAIDMANERVQRFGRDTDLMQHIEAVGTAPPKKAELKRNIPLVNTVLEPSKPFGYLNPDDSLVKEFNLFRATPGLRVLHNPDSFVDKYIEPTTTLQFLQTLVPEVEMHGYLLKFLKHKMLTLSYSPVILYFLGVQGSGKDTLVSMLETIISNIARPTVKEFLEPYNGYMCNNFFVQLDEYGNQLQRASDREEALGKLKAYSGKQELSLRVMRADGVPYKHRVTFIATANKNPLMLEDGERRIAFFDTPNKLEEQAWVKKLGGVAILQDKLKDEIVDFCYYLAVYVEDFKGDGYTIPPLTERKHELIANSMTLVAKIVYCFKHNKINLIIDLAEENECLQLRDELQSGTVHSSTVVEAYEQITEHQGDGKYLLKQLRTNPAWQRTNNKGRHDFKFVINPFEEEQECDTSCMTLPTL